MARSWRGQERGESLKVTFLKQKFFFNLLSFVIYFWGGGFFNFFFKFFYINV